MTDFKADFAKHHDAAGKAFKGGDHKGAASHMGNALRSLRKGGGGTTVTVTQADNPQPVGDEAPPPDQRGFGPGRQFGRGSGTGTPKPTATTQGKSLKASSSIRGRLSGLAKRMKGG